MDRFSVLVSPTGVDLRQELTDASMSDCVMHEVLQQSGSFGTLVYSVVPLLEASRRLVGDLLAARGGK